MVQADLEQDKAKTNPLIWVSIIVIGLIVFIFVRSDRGTAGSESLKISLQDELVVLASDDGTINRDLLIPPGLRAREYIGQIRTQGKPYPLEEVMTRASIYTNEGSLADAHLTFFFAAKEGHVEAMMMMAEMSDPILFQPENNLLDQADAVQAFKWYQLAMNSGNESARARLEKLHQWAIEEAKYGNTDAQQLLLNFN